MKKGNVALFKPHKVTKVIKASNSSLSNTSSDSNPLLSTIPISYITSRNKPIHLYFDLSQFNTRDFNNLIKEKIPIAYTYTVFVKVRYNLDSFFMAGSQFGFVFSSDEIIENLYSSIISRLQQYMGSYNLSEDSILYIQVSFIQQDRKLLSEVSLVKPSHISNYENVLVKDVLTVPISVNEDSIGKPLGVTIVNGFITGIDLIIKNNRVNFMNIILDKARILKTNHRDKITSFNENFKFYLLKDKYDYILAVNTLDSNSIEKIRYFLSGNIINHVTDSLNNDLVIRKSGEKQIIFNSNKEILFVKENIKLKAVDKPTIATAFIENNNIGSFDMETYLDNKGKVKVYALGFKSNLDKDCYIKYINRQTLDSDEIILNVVNELLRSRYSVITAFYCHNLGGFDIVFLLKALYRYNDNLKLKENLLSKEDKETKETPYKIKCILRDDKIIDIKVTRNKESFTIKDSYPMLPGSLSKLGKSFDVATIKSDFPYLFATEDNLFYTGFMPKKQYYNESLSDESYNAMFSRSWSFQDETIKYLKNDLESLFEIITKANKQVFMDYNVDMTEKLTISSLALRIFLKDFYNNNIPMINKPSLYKDIRKAYYGGITEVYKPHGYNLFYYDVNSLYPCVALKDMPGLNCSKLTYFDEIQDIDNLFGFFKVRVETPLFSKKDGYLSLLPVRKAAGLTFPLGKWEGWYFSEKLKFAKSNGYKITVLNGYSFNRESNVFTDYINKVYAIKSNPINPTQKSMAKSLLNNLLGRFAISLEKLITKLLGESYFRNLMITHKIIGYKNVFNDKVFCNRLTRVNFIL